MFILSIDIETTGLDPINDQILEIGLVAFPTQDDPAGRWAAGGETTCRILIKHPKLTGDAFALWLNRDLLYEIHSTPNAAHVHHAFGLMMEWLQSQVWWEDCKKLTPAGKNIGSFDLQFLQQLPGWDKKALKLAHRAMDVGPLFALVTDDQPPTLQECLDRAGIKGEVAHTAVSDARNVAELLKYHWNRG